MKSDMRSVRVSQCVPKLSQGAPSLSQGAPKVSQGAPSFFMHILNMATKEVYGDVESSHCGFTHHSQKHNKTIPKLFKSDLWIQCYEVSPPQMPVPLKRMYNANIPRAEITTFVPSSPPMLHTIIKPELSFFKNCFENGMLTSCVLRYALMLVKRSILPRSPEIFLRPPVHPPTTVELGQTLR